MTYKGKWPGTFAAICDVCGKRFPSDKLRDRWDGLKVCKNDWETRHPQDFIRIREEVVVPPWTRPENYTYTNVPYQLSNFNYAQYCPIIPTSIAGMTTAGCMIAGTPKQIL